MNDLVKENDIEMMIYEIGGEKVMLDSDLAKLYQCKNGTKEINQAVRNNLDKFPERYSWKLTDDDSKNLLVKIIDQKNKVDTRGGKYKNPRVFTEQGVAMLATILKTPVATQISIRIMDAFVAMRRYLNKNQDIYKSISNINNKLLEHDDKFRILFDKFDYKGEIVKINKSFEAYLSILDILNGCKKELIIDQYADNRLLDLISELDIKILLITSDKSKINKILLNSFMKEHLFNIMYDNGFHDRYIIIDRKEIYLCGTSINYIGNKLSTIIKIDSESMRECLINEINKVL